MDITEYQQNFTVQYCFPDNNASCRKEVRSGPAFILLFIFLSCVSVCTVFLNLLVIISISHFKQLHTPTNLLILSLAAADLLVGLIVMPVNIMQLKDSCWYFGKMACSISSVITCVSMTASIFNLVLIAVDRYIAVSDPLLYSTRVTVLKTVLLVIVGWSFCLLYVIIFLYFNDHLFPSQIITRCYGECVMFVKRSLMILDLVVFFLAPCFAIMVLYSIIFSVVRRQAKAVRAVRAVRKVTSKTHEAKVSSETKAAKTLGVVIFVYLACWIPLYLISLVAESVSTLSVLWLVFAWLAYVNSSLNPLMYAIFYPWFRTSVKYTITCQILKLSSSRFRLFSEQF